ncbi:hypothetical protein [Burkholderia anthina]|uniref:hypothetical protein n=1 Tax=Burkholderia anthina TaxID=179879 RepID=UPI00158D0B23|nr:hypothetical protein [Burkholderia anthina]
MTTHPTARDAGSLMRIIVLSAATVTVALSGMSTAFAQDSAPVTSSVFVHQPYDSGNSAINDNFQYIAHPPIRPVTVSTPTVVHGGHRGRRGQAGATSTPSGGSGNEAAVPLPTMPTDGTSGGPVTQ